MLPIFNTNTRELSMMQTSWSSALNPLVDKPMLNGVSLAVALKAGANVINHRLGRKPQGWIITDITAAATVYRSAAFDPLTLTLTASAPCNISLEVF